MEPWARYQRKTRHTIDLVVESSCILGVPNLAGDTHNMQQTPFCQGTCCFLCLKMSQSFHLRVCWEDSSAPDQV